MGTIIRVSQLVDGSGLPAKKDAEILLEDGRIRAVGPWGSQPAIGHQVVEYPDATALPGFIDLHTHFCYLEDSEFQKSAVRPNRAAMVENGFHNAKEWLYEGVTTARVVGTPFDLDIGLKQAIAEQPELGPRLFTAGRMMTMVGGRRTPWDYMKEEVNGAEEARQFARKHLREGADVIKLYCTTLLEEDVGKYLERVLALPDQAPDPGRWSSLTIDEIQAVTSEAHKVGATVAAHVAPAFGIKIALRGGVDTIDHGSEMDDECIDLFLKTGATLVPTLAVMSHQVEHGDELGIPRVFTDFALKRWEPNRQKVLDAFHAGVNIGTGTDSIMTGQMYFVEMEQLVATGLTPLQAICCATSNSAKALGPSGIDLGRIQPDMRADIVICSTDPVVDIHNIRSVAAVWKDGALVAEPQQSETLGKVGHRG